MADTAAALLNIATVVFAAGSMLLVGLGHDLAEVLRPLRDLRSVARALIANFVLVPALALLVLRIVPLEEHLGTGLLLIAAAAGTPFVIKLSQAARADAGLTITLLLLLLPVTVVFMPLVVPLLQPGANVRIGAIAAPLVMTMIIPLVVGLLVRRLWANGALRLRPLLSNLSTTALIVLVASALIANFDVIVRIGWRAPLAAALVIAGAFVLGYLLGGNDPDNREVLGLGTAQRNIAAVTVVATQTVGHPDTVSMVVISSLVGLAVLFPTARVLYRREIQRW
ncbi:bile acid:sodium symporter family protein [Streptomyces thermolineatus]|uniref:Bile acid:sodium symporter family protein n=1 Tax=Streptomyces thermolineatus TaxID=44033 RepID=A0ABP6A185_9ACTN